MTPTVYGNQYFIVMILIILWLPNNKIEKQLSKRTPAVADKYIIHNDDESNRLWHTYSNTSQGGTLDWIYNELQLDLNSDLAPSLTIHENALHMEYVVAGTHNLMHAFSHNLMHAFSPL
jgi:hypothetical protein